jgi:hypothetical protein
MGAMYAFVGVNREKLPNFDDQKFALELLERKHVLIAPGTSFNVPYTDHFRLTLLPDWETMREVFARIESLLQEQFVEVCPEATAALAEADHSPKASPSHRDESAHTGSDETSSEPEEAIPSAETSHVDEHPHGEAPAPQE